MSHGHHRLAADVYSSERVGGLAQIMLYYGIQVPYYRIQRPFYGIWLFFHGIQMPTIREPGAFLRDAYALLSLLIMGFRGLFVGFG